MSTNLLKHVLLAALCLFSFALQAQTYPSQTIKIVVGFSPGGVPDIAARILGQQMTERWQQAV